MTKQCRTCGELKPVEKFKLTNPRTGNRRPDCYQCVYKLNRDDTIRRSREWALGNADKIRANGYFKRYGITVEWYEAQLARQGGLCAVCGADNPRRANVTYFAIDHSHVTGEARGLLCSPCNVGLGMLQDDVQILGKAIDYLNDRSEHD